jgi:hypothetical protein
MTYRTDRADGDQLTPNDDEIVPQDRQAVRDDDDELAAGDRVIMRDDDDELVPADDQVVLRGVDDDEEGDDDELGLADGRLVRDDDELVPVHDQVVPGDDQLIAPQDDQPAPGLAAPGLARPQGPGAFDAGEPAGQPETDGAAAADGTAAAVPAPDSAVPATAPDAAVPAAGAEPGPSAVRAAVPDRTSLGVRWHEIQAMFVDDPRTSVELAAGMVDDSTEAFVASIRERQQSLLSVWQGSDTDTEGLRTALQGYRAFWNRLEDFSSES